MRYIMPNRILNDIQELAAEHINIEDIAHSLSMQCRFNGQTPVFYSVAEHSVFVSELCEHGKAGLLHDAHEAYLGDIIRPIREIIDDQYGILADRVDKLICEKFNINLDVCDIKRTDDIVLKMELWKFFGVSVTPGIKRASNVIRGLSPIDAKKYFLKRWEYVRFRDY